MSNNQNDMFCSVPVIFCQNILINLFLNMIMLYCIYCCYLLFQSHTVGPGPDIERVLFNLKGQSPLVAHYLRMRQLKEKPVVGRRVRRTQVSKQKYPCWNCVTVSWVQISVIVHVNGLAQDYGNWSYHSLVLSHWYHFTSAYLSAVKN